MMWLITGAGRGLGRAFAEAALERGDTVVGTVRDDGALAGLASPRLVERRLDVTDRAAARELISDVGTPDVLVNNAGYGLVGAVEELGEDEVRAQFDVNVFGAIWLTQAALPGMRRRGSGRIVQVSTVGAVGHLPLFGAYNASKWALEGFSAALADEVQPHGIRVHLLQLAGFATDWAGSSMRYAAAEPAYDETRTAIFGGPAYPDPATPANTGETGDDPWAPASPSVAAAALIDLLAEPDPPLRKVIGPGGYDMVRLALQDRRDDYRRDPSFVWPA